MRSAERRLAPHQESVSDVLLDDFADFLAAGLASASLAAAFFRAGALAGSAFACLAFGSGLLLVDRRGSGAVVTVPPAASTALTAAAEAPVTSNATFVSLLD